MTYVDHRLRTGRRPCRHHARRRERPGVIPFEDIEDGRACIGRRSTFYFEQEGHEGDSERAGKFSTRESTGV